MRLRDMSIRWQLIALCVLLVTIPVAILGIISYNTAKAEMIHGVEARLAQQAVDWKELTESYVEEANTVGEQEEVRIRKQVAAFALDAKRMMHFITDQYGEPPPEVVNELYRYLSTMKVSKDGFIFILDQQGNFLVREGEVGFTNMLDAQDADGNPYVQELIRKGVDTDGVAFHEFSLRPNRDRGVVKMIAAMTYFKEGGIIVGAMAPYADFIEEDVSARFKEAAAARMANQLIGDSGYIWAVNSKGEYVVSKGQETDGTSVWELQENQGRYLVQELITKSKELDTQQSYVRHFALPGTGLPKIQVAAVTYVPEWDWIIIPTAYLDEFLDGLNEIKRSTFFLSLIMILVGSILATLLAHMLTGPLTKVTHQLKSIAEGEGDLTQRLDVKGKNEIGLLATHFNRFIGKQDEMISMMKNVAWSSAKTANELAVDAQQVNESMQDVFTAIQQVAQGTQTLSTNAAAANQVSKQTGVTATESSDSAAAINERMAKIVDSTAVESQKIGALGEKSNEIGGIAETIWKISDTTNLLALNAAVEAARAGYAGRGFGVVADQVRKLAKNSRDESGLVNDIITAIQEDINASVESMQQNTLLVEESTATVNQAVTAIREIPSLVEKVTGAIDEINKVALENASAAEEVTASIGEVTDTMGLVSTAATSLHKESEELQRLVSHFKTSGAPPVSPKENKEVKEPKG